MGMDGGIGKERKGKERKGKQNNLGPKPVHSFIYSPGVSSSLPLLYMYLCTLYSYLQYTIVRKTQVDINGYILIPNSLQASWYRERKERGRNNVDR
ncbi:hypothetical protein P175DRAFT_0250204 [Aspergillus ochraceoroseus IBT 24754]|uniref:Uncharacterized protein n=1 Tax=Aspergillus ochraceoroseus IBT 24754 TaxID=1392256 RepID=A0A2T5LY51_9EURO|nr:uncharacterized protein P175DRAFT_0250204 [Aspergillus ochraceoroseus IBT 24754]PTU21205.1 hypothetical protein P175DRAFT_0250204 [Aspergillus ochraceoroseus IBT 24754]